MKNKRESAPTLLSCLSLFLFAFTASEDLSAGMPKSRIRTTHGGWDVISDSNRSLAEVFGFNLPKEYMKNASSFASCRDDREDISEIANKKTSGLAPAQLQQMKLADGSGWLINETALTILKNDPQQLIQSTIPGDRVVFNLTGPQKFNQTLVVNHDLEFISKSVQANGTRSEAIFTCPDDGPFLRIESSEFNASGFIIQNCTKSTGEGAITIQSNSTITFENVSLSSNRKRAISVGSNASLTLRSCYFENNGVPSTNGNQSIKGGAIRVIKNVRLSINSSSFHGNNASFGGVIHGADDNTIIISSSNLSRNYASGQGGVIWLSSENSLIVNDTTLSLNNATRTGGVWLARNNTATITNTVFSRNYAARECGAFGLTSENHLVLLNTTLLGNAAEYGGAMQLSKRNTLILRNTTWSGNIAANNGGAIRISYNNNMTAWNTKFLENTAFSGGAIYSHGSNNLTIMSTTFSGNVAIFIGGAIRVSRDSVLTISNTTMLRNNASAGGAISLVDNNNVTVLQTTLSYNQARHGGAILLNDNNVVAIGDTLFEGNKASRNGGALSFESNNSITITNTMFLENSASWDGGAFWLYANNKLTLFNTSISRNNATWSGGAINLLADNKVTILGCVISNNSALRLGGAIQLSTFNNLTLIKTILSGSRANDGGAIWLSKNNNLTIITTSLSRNRALRDGGALMVGSNNNLTLSNTSMIENHAENGGSIRLLVNNNLSVLNTTVSRNQARNDGGSLCVDDNNQLTIIHTNFSRNHGTNGGAIRILQNNLVTTKEISLLENSASKDGGAIWCKDNNNLTILSSNLLGNIALRNGGAIWLNESNHLDISTTTLSTNMALGDGGATWINNKNNVTIANSTLNGNHALSGGAIVSDEECVFLINYSNFTKNKATFGGCFSGKGTLLVFQDSLCQENLASKDGGCLYLRSSNVTLEGSRLSLNHANANGGGVNALTNATLYIRSTSIVSNSANDGGGVALLNGSRLLCVSCLFENNSAIQGGGLYIISNASQFLLGQFTTSIFRANKASSDGGGMVVKTFGIKAYDCKNLSTPCDRIVLDGTTFIENSATIFGSSIVGTKPESILVNCEARYTWAHGFMDVDMIRMRWNHSSLRPINPKLRCRSWKEYCSENDTCANAIGTFGRTFNVTIDSSSGAQLIGNNSVGFVITNAKSGKPFPKITVTTIDAFGHTNAPTLFERVSLQPNSSNDVLESPTSCSFKNRICTISNQYKLRLQEHYSYQIKTRDDDILEATNITIVVQKCLINEEVIMEGEFCEPCGEASYDFNLSSSAKCRPCPENANCTTRYIKPKQGYWHKGPCHAKVKRCIVGEACEVQDRLEKLDNLTRNLVDCNMTKMMLSNYGENQCQEGYEGPLCGSCKKSYGLSLNSECSKCGHAIIITLRFFGAVMCLLVGTLITIKGCLPSSSSQHIHQDVEASLLEHDNASSMDVATSNQVVEEVEHRNQDPLETIVERDVNSLNSESQEVNEVEVTKQKFVSSWKISLNYLQVTSTAAGMDVEWTKKIVDMLEGLNLLGEATTNSTSYSFDCLFSSTSNSSKAIWRLLFCLIIPLIVISLLSLYWGYRSMTKHGKDLGYFLRRLTLTVITVTYATYFDLTQVAMRTFSCVAVHADVDHFSNVLTRYWTGDTSIECSKNAHIILICISLVIVALVTVGFPMFSSFTLNQHQNEVRDTSSWTHDTVGFLGGPFKQRFIYWECVTMIKKAILSIIIVFAYSLEVQAQGLLILLVLVFFLYTHFLCYPYDEKYHTLNYYESGSLLVSCVTYTLIQFFNVENISSVARSIVSLSVIAINVGFVCLMVYKIVTDLAHLLRALLKSQNIHVPNSMNVISLMRVYPFNQKSR